MGVYRVEESPNNRAGCHVAACKTAKVKITKGELRFATQVTVNEHQSWQFRHWGCVTPKQIENFLEACSGDTDMVDGFDELPSEYQEKIKYALENGHVHDDDWKGDVELNRPGKKGHTKRSTPKKANKHASKADSAESTPKKKNAEDAPKLTKKRGRPAKKEANDDDKEESAPTAKVVTRTRGKKVEYKEESEGSEAAPRKKARGRRAAVKVESAEEDHETEE